MITQTPQLSGTAMIWNNSSCHYTSLIASGKADIPSSDHTPKWNRHFCYRYTGNTLSEENRTPHDSSAQSGTDLYVTVQAETRSLAWDSGSETHLPWNTHHSYSLYTEYDLEERKGGFPKMAAMKVIFFFLTVELVSWVLDHWKPCHLHPVRYNSIAVLLLTHHWAYSVVNRPLISPFSCVRPYIKYLLDILLEFYNFIASIQKHVKTEAWAKYLSQKHTPCKWYSQDSNTVEFGCRTWALYRYVFFIHFSFI